MSCRRALIIETPRDAHLEHTRILRVACNSEILLVAKQIVVHVLVFQENAHSLPLSRQEHIEVGVITQLVVSLVVERCQCRVVRGRIIRRIEASIDTELYTQNLLLLYPEFVVVREVSAEQRYGNNLLICTPLQQCPVVKMKSANAEIFASIHMTMLPMFSP